jgi:hypothetical protein
MGGTPALTPGKNATQPSSIHWPLRFNTISLHLSFIVRGSISSDAEQIWSSISFCMPHWKSCYGWSAKKNWQTASSCAKAQAPTGQDHTFRERAEELRTLGRKFTAKNMVLSQPGKTSWFKVKYHFRRRIKIGGNTYPAEPDNQPGHFN